MNVPVVQAKDRFRASGPGYSLTAAAKVIPMPRKRLQRAVDNGEVATVVFGGVRLITAQTINEIRERFGIAS